MKQIILILTIIFLIGCTQTITESNQIKQPIKEVIKMNLISNNFNHEDDIPVKFTCQGDDINPHLAWSDFPADTKSFALIMDDPDAPNGLWIHWLVKDIPKDVYEIQENSVEGVEVVNSFRKTDYGGPCPPSGKHRYFFKLYALDVETLGAETSEDFYKQVEEHKIGESVLMGLYQKS